MLDKLQGTDADEELKRIPVQERLKWCFRKQHVTYLLAQLDSLKLSLIVMLRTMQLGQLIASRSWSGGLHGLQIAADDDIVQEKAETQNMIIVRYWSVKRLDRLWDLVEQEAAEAAKDQTNQRISSNYPPSTALQPLIDATQPSNPSKLHVVTFGDIDVGLSDIERSPKDMVHLSENAMNRLLYLWMPSLGPLMLQNASKPSNPPLQQPHASISSESEDDLSDPGSDSPHVRGYYLEGNTTDWRKPQSQEARQYAAQLRSKYSKYQARVESGSDPEDNLPLRETKPAKTQIPSNGESGEQRNISRQSSNRSTRNGRAHANSLPSRSSPPQNQDGKPAAHPSVSFAQPGAQTIPRSQAPGLSKLPLAHVPGPPTQPYQYYPSQEHGSAPRPIPRSQPSPTMAMPDPSPRSMPPSQYEPWDRVQGYSSPQGHRRYHPPAHKLSSSVPESSSRASPPRPVQRSPSHSSRRSSREEAKERHKALTRNATRGLVGIGAIAGFMDALEAFSIL